MDFCGVARHCLIAMSLPSIKQKLSNKEGAKKICETTALSLDEGVPVSVRNETNPALARMSQKHKNGEIPRAKGAPETLIICPTIDEICIEDASNQACYSITDHFWWEP